MPFIPCQYAHCSDIDATSLDSTGRRWCFVSRPVVDATTNGAYLSPMRRVWAPRMLILSRLASDVGLYVVQAVGNSTWERSVSLAPMSAFPVLMALSWRGSLWLSDPRPRLELFFLKQILLGSNFTKSSKIVRPNYYLPLSGNGGM